MTVGLESDVVGAEDSQEELLAARQDAEDLRGRERYVEEEPDRYVGIRLSEEAREKHEVVVVNPDEISGPETTEHGVPKALVGLDVGLPASRGELQKRGELVEEGPERLVGVALVEARGQGTGQVDGNVAAVPLPPFQGDLAGRIGFLGPSPGQPNQSPPVRSRTGPRAVTSRPRSAPRPSLLVSLAGSAGGDSKRRADAARSRIRLSRRSSDRGSNDVLPAGALPHRSAIKSLRRVFSPLD